MTTDTTFDVSTGQTARTDNDRIARAFAQARVAGRTALIPYLMCGEMELETTLDCAEQLGAAGADLLELGMPFSDALADGPTVRRSADRALARGTTVADCIATAAAVRRRVGPELPIVLMGYLNPLLQFGEARFAALASAAGVDGLIVADLPLEASAVLHAALADNDIAPIQLVAPTTTDARLARLTAAARGFVYCVSSTGVTGARADLAASAEQLVTRTRALTDLPLVVGFGVSSAAHVARIGEYADGAVVASALLDRLDGVATQAQPDAAGRFVQELRG